MTENELDKLLENAYNILRENSTNILMAIKLIGEFELSYKKNLRMLEILDNCFYLQKSFKKLDTEIMEIEKKFIDKIFSQYENIQHGWLMYDYIDKHVLIYSAILFHNLNDYIIFNRQLIKEFYLTFPYKYNYHLKSGKELLHLKHLLETNYKLYRDKLDIYSPYVFNNFEIKNDKYYILREYNIINLCNDYKMNYMDNVFIYGINSTRKAKKVMNKLNAFNSKRIIFDIKLFVNKDIEIF